MNKMRRNELAVCLALVLWVPGQALASDPVSQCTDNGETPVSGGGGSDVGFLPHIPNAGTAKSGASDSPVAGNVSLKSGGFSFSNDDLAAGQGGFPARISLTRTYSSDQDLWGEDHWGPDEPALPGSPEWYYFGRGSTHNLDGMARTGEQVFSGKKYHMVYIRVGFTTMVFQKCLNGTYVNSKRDGSKLTPTSLSNTWQLELNDGTTLLFGNTSNSMEQCENWTTCSYLTKWTAPNGDWAAFSYEKYFSHASPFVDYQNNERMTIYDSSEQLCANTLTGTQCKYIFRPYYHIDSSSYEDRINDPMYRYRLRSVSTSRNYKIEFSYVDETSDVGSYCYLTYGGWGSYRTCLPKKNISMERNRVSSARLYDIKSTPALLQQVSYQYGSRHGVGYLSDYLMQFTAADSGVWRYTFSPTQLKLYTPLSTTTPVTTITFADAPAGIFYELPVANWQSTLGPVGNRHYDAVSSQSFPDGRVINYSYVYKQKFIEEQTAQWLLVDFVSRTTVDAGSGAVTVYQFDNEDGPTQVTDPLNRVTTNTYNTIGALTSSTDPEGIVTSYTYDVRGNIVLRTRAPKPGSGLSPIVETSTYVGGTTLDASACANQKTCNRPTATIDPMGRQTDYSWAATGLPLTITAPADAGGERPVTTFGYTGYTSPDGSQVQLLTSKADKINASATTTTTYVYTTADRLNLTEVIGDTGAVNARTCMKYDAAGNVISKTAPSGAAAGCP